MGNNKGGGNAEAVGIMLDDARSEHWSFADRLERFNSIFNSSLAWLAGFCLTAIVVLVATNTISRVAGTPIQGVSEMVGWLFAVSTSFSLGYTQLAKGHVSIDILVSKLSEGIKKPVLVSVDLLSMFFFGIVAWQLVGYGLDSMASGQLSQTLQLAFYPLIWIVAFGFLGLTLSLLSNLVKQLAGRDEQ